MKRSKDKSTTDRWDLKRDALKVERSSRSRVSLFNLKYFFNFLISDDRHQPPRPRQARHRASRIHHRAAPVGRRQR